MCLTVYDKKPSIAKQDMYVWKIVCTNGNKWIGPYMFDFTKFSFDEIVKPKHPKPFEHSIYERNVGHRIEYDINGGYFHSCLTKEECVKLFPFVRKYLIKAKMEAYGATYKEFAMEFDRLEICKCTIPARTKYYTNEIYVASERLIVHKPKIL